MLKDIPQLEIDAKEIMVALTPSTKGDDIWDCHLINMGDNTYENILISSKGYGEVDGEYKSTTSFRHFVESLAPKTSQVIEVMPNELFDLTNEFWVSCNMAENRYDKKFYFKQGEITTDKFVTIPVLNTQGIAAS